MGCASIAGSVALPRWHRGKESVSRVGWILVGLDDVLGFVAKVKLIGVIVNKCRL